MNAKRFVVAAALLALSYGGALADAAGPIQWQQVPSSSSCSPVFNTTTGAVTCSAGSGGITALTGDVTASGTGSVAATVVSIGGKTVSLGGTFTISGAFNTTLTVTGATNVTLPTSGTLINTSALPSAGGTQLYVGTGAAGAAAALAASGGGTTNFLRADMTWAAAGGGPCAVGGGTTSVLCNGGTGGANTAAGTNGGAFAGYSNVAGSGTEDVVLGGHGNTINSGNQDAIIAGSSNTLGNGNSGNVIVGGTGNSMVAFGGGNNVIAGGSSNQANGNGSEFIAGYNNTASGNASFISGHDNSNSGEANSAMGSSNTVANGGGGRNLVGGYNNGCGSLDYASIVWAWQVGNCAGTYQAAFGVGPFVNGDTSTFLGNFPQGRSASSSLYVGGGRQGRGDTSGAEQFAFYQVNCQFSSTSACELKDPTGNRITINLSALGYLVNIKMIAVDRTGLAFAVWTFTNGLIATPSNAASTAVGTGNPVFVAGPTVGTFPTCATVPTLTADTTGGNLIITGPVCAANTHNISLQARVETVEVRGAF